MQRVVYAASAKITNRLESLDKRGSREADSLLQLLLRDAIKRRASSLHLEPQTTSTIVRLRIDGRLLRSKIISKHLHDPLVAAIKRQAELDDQTFLPQNGSFTIEIAHQPTSIHATCLPTLIGERIVLHLEPAEPTTSLQQLGYWGSPLTELGRWLALPRGLILLVGDHGSQLQQTSAAIMRLLQQPSLRVAHVSGSTSRQPSAKLNLALIDNPDVILINNLSGSDLIDTAVSAAASHLVIGVTSAASAEAALLEVASWASDQYSLSRFLVGVVFQSSEALLCPICRQVHPLSSVQQKLISTHYPDMGELLGHYRSTYGLPSIPAACYSREPKGCKACHHSGTNGQIAIPEISPASIRLKRLIINGDISLRTAQSELRKSAILKSDADHLTKALAGHIEWRSLAA